MEMSVRVVVFLLMNFGALAIGGFFTSKGVPSDWYVNLNKAPWTPPGWVFGIAWTLIMVCFSIYMAQLWSLAENKVFIGVLFLLQLILNIIWNPTFFQFHNVALGLAVISALTVLIGVFIFNFQTILKMKALLALPYLLWLMIATSLNAYILFKN